MNSELGVDIIVKKDIVNDCFIICMSNGYDTFNGALSFKDLKRLGADINNLIEREEAQNERKKNWKSIKRYIRW